MKKLIVLLVVVGAAYKFGPYLFLGDPDTPEGYAKRFLTWDAELDPERDYRGQVESGTLYLKGTVSNEGLRDLEDVALRVWLEPKGGEMNSTVDHLGPFKAGEKRNFKKAYEHVAGEDSADGTVTYIEYKSKVELEGVELRE